MTWKSPQNGLGTHISNGWETKPDVTGNAPPSLGPGGAGLATKGHVSFFSRGAQKSPDQTCLKLRPHFLGMGIPNPGLDDLRRCVSSETVYRKLFY